MLLYFCCCRKFIARTGGQGNPKRRATLTRNTFIEKNVWICVAIYEARTQLLIFRFPIIYKYLQSKFEFFAHIFLWKQEKNFFLNIVYSIVWRSVLVLFIIRVRWIFFAVFDGWWLMDGIGKRKWRSAWNVCVVHCRWFFLFFNLPACLPTHLLMHSYGILYAVYKRKSANNKTKPMEFNLRHPKRSRHVAVYVQKIAPDVDRLWP